MKTFEELYGTEFTPNPKILNPYSYTVKPVKTVKSESDKTVFVKTEFIESEPTKESESVEAEEPSETKIEEVDPPVTDVALVNSEYEVKKGIFGKLKVRKIK